MTLAQSLFASLFPAPRHVSLSATRAPSQIDLPLPDRQRVRDSLARDAWTVGNLLADMRRDLARAPASDARDDALRNLAEAADAMARAETDIGECW